MYLCLRKRASSILKLSGILAMLALLVACGDTNNTNNQVSLTPTIQSGTVAANTPGAGPTVIAVSTVVVIATDVNTPASTAKQVITFSDRTLTIAQVSKLPGTGSSTAISLTVTVANTGKSPIMNESTFYQLEGAEGDAFGTQSSVSASFYGEISPHGSRQGTIVFQVPTPAATGIHLLYRSEVATETALIPLNP